MLNLLQAMNKHSDGLINVGLASRIMERSFNLVMAFIHLHHVKALAFVSPISIQN